MKKAVSLLLTAVFLLLCLLPSAGMLLWGEAASGANEVLSVRPALKNRDGTINRDYLPALCDYWNDRFALRSEGITLWARLNAELLHTSATDSVLLGENGVLYYASTLPDYTGSEPMTARELWCAARTLFLLQEYVEGQDGVFVFACAPNKNSLYDSDMPELVRLSKTKNIDALHALLSEMGVSCADLLAAFREEEAMLYFRTDSHWNARGAALAADTLLSAAGRTGHYAAGPFASDALHRGDLYEMLYPAGRKTETDFTYSPGLDYRVTSRSDDADSILLTAEGGGTGRLLCYRDSFGRNLFPYLADAFARSEFSRKTDYDPTSVEAGDVMMVELVERNLRYLDLYAPTLPAPERPAPDAAEESGVFFRLREEKCSLDGWRRLTGTLPMTPDADSPVLFLCGETIYEAIPGPESFTVCVEDTKDLTNAGIYITVDGSAVLCRAERME